jgi:hypothetical protein
MTYAGATMGSTVTNPPVSLTGLLSGGQASGLGMAGKSLWFYTSTHTAAECFAANFFTDAKALGMKNGDIMLGVTGSAASTTPFLFGGVVVSVTTSGGNLSSAIITSTAV